MDWVKIEAGDAGNITVTISKIRQKAGEQGVAVDRLTSFVAWLETAKSNVAEWGFSNSSLEEVFLKVTEGDVDEVSNDTEGDGQTVSSNVDEQVADSTTAKLASFTPSLSVHRQAMALVYHNFISTWTGSRSIGSWSIYGLFVVVSTILGVLFANVYDKLPGLSIQVGFLSFILLSISSSLYGDRSEGLFYLMRTQGLLKTSYLLGSAVYGLAVTIIYSLVMLTLLYATPLFRQPSVCVPNYNTGEYCDGSFGDLPVVDINGLSMVPIDDQFEGQQVSLYAYLTPGGLGKLLGAGFVFALTVPGAMLASAYLPGHKFALLVIAVFSIGATVTPIVIYFTSTAISTEAKLNGCFDIEPCLFQFQADTVDEEFLDCVGVFAGRLSSLCIPPYAGLLPQFGFFQMLSMTMVSNIRFYSEPAGYAEQVFIPKVQGGDCSGDVCAFPLAGKLYRQNAGWEVLGAVMLLFIGIVFFHVFAFPTTFVLRIKNSITHVIGCIRCKNNRTNDDELPKEKVEFAEVRQEREVVQEIIGPLLAGAPSDSEPTIADHSKVPRDELPPILMHKLRKVFPSFGRVPPKVALNSLDLQVPKGQVLGFLGKNGAGKTTALKILSGAHDATSGIGLLAGHDVACERISVFERLGSCPQFDVVWPKLSVKEHLVFFAKLKGIPRADVQTAALDIATAVGLGTKQVYNRRAGELSGGMRRRLSIAISLVGAPSVFLLDEPTTGLDPSTRNSIWSLVNSFATDERAIVITTHNMLEADTLSNRIAIIAKGELVVCASQQHLKDRFGSGYLLQLNLVKSTPENQEEAMVFARKHLHHGATLQTKQAKTLHINLPRELDLVAAFSALYDPAVRPECINQFLLSQSSLEDVFIALGE